MRDRMQWATALFVLGFVLMLGSMAIPDLRAGLLALFVGFGLTIVAALLMNDPVECPHGIPPAGEGLPHLPE